MKVKIFPYFKILNFRSDDVTFLRNVRNGHFGKKLKKNRTTLVAIARRTKIVIKKRQRITKLTENTPSCNYCVATIVARPLQTTVKGGRQPSGLRRNQD